MEASRLIELTRIEEIKILQHVRLVHHHDLNSIYSKENFKTQFSVTGELRGTINCYLCFDGLDLSVNEKDHIFSLFIEAMNILIGQQISLDEELSLFHLKLMPPKLSKHPTEINTSHKRLMQKYSLELSLVNYLILIEYNLEALN